MERLSRIAEALGRWTSRWVPSAFSIAVLLTLLTAVVALVWAGASPAAALKAWGGGFWELLSFSMQMALVMFTGYLLALTGPVKRLIEKVASLPKSPRGAVVLVALCSMAMAYFNWGLSLVGSAMLVRFVVRKRPEVDYRLLVACAYFGLGATWHAGLSASAPLTVATPKHFLEAQVGVIGLDQTLFSAFNLGLTFGTVALLCGLAWAMHPAPERTVRVDPKLLELPAPPPPPPAERTFASWVDRTWALNGLFGLAALGYWGTSLADAGWRNINLNSVNFLFFALAVTLHRSPRALLTSSEEAASTLSGVVLQFPLYAGIYGLFKSTALTERLGDLFVSASTKETFPALVYLYSGVVNYFVPSGGAKWAIEGPYLLKAAATLQVPPSKVVLAYAWGDMATDLIQPFWALPLLGIAKLEFKDILGFLLLAFFVYFPLVTLAFLLAG
ncbi:MAG: atoE [Myxococcaceae bacterium]|nr:atoE [Myxococcaceae bacterium]